MVQSCPDVSAKMMELLYGELPEEVRADVEAHIAGCARCAAEREGFEQTRAVARAVLDDPPPARSRAAILQAAAAHAAGVQARRPQAAAAAAPAVRAAVQPSKQPEPRSFWDWIRSRWALPTLATVGAVATFVLGSRLFMDPERTYERGKQVLAPEAAHAPEAPAIAVERLQGEGEPRAGAAPTHGSADFVPDHGDVNPSVAVRERRRGPGRGAAGGRAKASTESLDGLMAADRASDRGRTTGGRPLAGLAGAEPPSGGSDSLKRKFAPPPPPKAEAEADKKLAPAAPGSVVAQSRAAREKAPAAEGQLESGEEIAKVAREASSRQARRDEVVAEAKPAERPAPAPAAAAVASAPPPAPRPAATKRPAKAQIADDDVGSGVAYGGGGLGAPAAKTTAEKTTAENAPAAKATAKKSAKGAAAPKDVTALALRADRLFAEGRWSEAAAAYRDLIRLDPDNTAAGRWQQRLAVSRTQNEATVASPPQAAPPAKADKSAVGH